jgi:uncharacterized membrane protein
VVIAAVTAIAAVLILARLAHRSLEQDETFSAVLVRTPAHVFWHVVTTREANQSAFYVLLRVWSHLGITEGWERLPSALAAIASVPVVWLVGRRVVPGVAAVIAPSLLVANGFFLRVAQFGRGYAFVVLMTTSKNSRRREDDQAVDQIRPLRPSDAWATSRQAWKPPSTSVARCRPS